MTRKNRSIFLIILIICVVKALPGHEPESVKYPLVFFLPVGYDFIKLDEQTIHSPVGGVGFILGKQDLPYDQIERCFMGMAAYQPYIFTEEVFSMVPKKLRQIGGMLDARIKRHQILTIFQANSDKPLFGGANTFQFGAGYGYEIIRKSNVSLILGAVLGVRDFSGMGVNSMILPLPLIRFGVDTRWFTSSFDFITGPIWNFTIAPKEKIRFTGSTRMETYRSIADIDCEFMLWYRLFTSAHKLGDFAGIGLGFKNELSGFDLSNNIKADTFELQRSSILASIDLSFIKIECGWVLNSNYLIDDKKIGCPGKGFFFSIQGMIPIYQRQ